MEVEVTNDTNSKPSRAMRSYTRKREGKTMAVVEVSANAAFKLQTQGLLPPDFGFKSAPARKKLMSEALAIYLEKNLSPLPAD